MEQLARAKKNSLSMVSSLASYDLGQVKVAEDKLTYATNELEKIVA